MTTIWLETIDSTHRYLSDALKNGSMVAPCAVAAREQTSGRGSRGNAWIGQQGNLFVSFALSRDVLPKDLKLESASIYFAWIMLETLRYFGASVWLKWPNDFFVNSTKAGGLITTMTKEILICGIGLNLKSSPDGYARIVIKESQKEILYDYFRRLENFPHWKQIFRLYALEFDKSRRYTTHYDSDKISLQDAVLCEDGAVVCDGQRMYSLR